MVSGKKAKKEEDTVVINWGWGESEWAMAEMDAGNINLQLGVNWAQLIKNNNNIWSWFHWCFSQHAIMTLFSISPLGLEGHMCAAHGSLQYKATGVWHYSRVRPAVH